MSNWKVHNHEYSQGKCDECGAEGKITITKGTSRCPDCQVNWLIEKARE